MHAAVGGKGVRAKATIMPGEKRAPTYLSLQCAGQQLCQGLARLVAVADILKGLGRVLAADVEEDLLATTRDC